LGPTLLWPEAPCLDLLTTPKGF